MRHAVTEHLSTIFNKLNSKPSSNLSNND